ncbi:hypothetical protein HYALB_00001682 [Hymenoscyphus albidus]|uniref:Uncharacterized protein n=1 Tax=Hymenoscyphus albidus TaxID=595503 RepID=A0A9N9Q216_9HELO|nr:hypothetical protein HYALB_00001682 [Hymenoscyphus albidus]
MAPIKAETPNDNDSETFPSSSEKPMSTTPTPANNTRRRGSTAVKRPPNGNGNAKPSNNTSTPARKAATQNKMKTPTSAPARTRTGAKKAEPTLLADFLLGRPSPARVRSKSVHVLKADMRADLVGKVQRPAGTNDRVKNWQKTSAAAIVIDPLADVASLPDDLGGWENEDDGSVDEEARLRIKFRGDKRSHIRGRSSVSHPANEAPKKRVISDSQWMKNKKKTPPKTSAIPKNFLQATATNPPLEKKISDWVKRTEADAEAASKPKERPRSRKVSKHDLLEKTRSESSRPGTPDDGIRIKPSPAHSFDDGIRVKPGGSSLVDDGIRVTPLEKKSKSRDALHDSEREDGPRTSMSSSLPKTRKSDVKEEIPRTKLVDHKAEEEKRAGRSKDGPVDDGIRIKPVRKKESKMQNDNSDVKDLLTPRKKSEKQLRVPSDAGSARKTSSQTPTQKDELDDDDKFSTMTPSPPEGRKRRKQKAQTPPESLADVPFGNSAFSTLDLPLGAEAGNTVKRPPPKRNPSFAGVPKVLKKVFNEGMKLAHDTAEPPRGGTNHPPSIESWLKGTSDPFVDKPTPPASILDVPETEPSDSRKPSYKKDDQLEKALTAERERSENKPKRHERSTPELPENKAPLEVRKSREALPSMTTPPPMSPGSLKRTGATRNTSSPKIAKKLPLKDVLMDAFRGESTTSRPRSMSNPFVEITGLRERDINSSPRPIDHRISRDFGDDASSINDTPRKATPRALEKHHHDEPEKKKYEVPHREKNLAPRKKMSPVNGGHRLSTIASAETFSTSSSAMGISLLSELSQTTVTQLTATTVPTASGLSRNSQKGNKSGLKRRLTKHSDLVSVLSLPDVVQPARGSSVKSMRSIRSNRNRLETATLKDHMKQLGNDEVKYAMELKTLVDGVIPVLLTCVLSKSESAIAAGLFNPNHDASCDPAITKPIVDMGIALERLRSLHKQIPLVDADAFITWAQRAHKTYEDYLVAWRAGFQDVVVNLEPSKAKTDEKLAIDGIARDKNGDAVAANGERADVAYFLKRPLVRVKLLARTTKGLNRVIASEKSKLLEEKYQALNETVRRRYQEESARIEDENANNTDPTRARDPRTLDLVEGVKIDRTRQVCARDVFYLDLQHSGGQRLDCRIELILRDKPNDEGDVLICDVDDLRRYLLFPPIAKGLISARLGENQGQVVIMIRGNQGPMEWSEVMLLDSGDAEAASEWVELLGTYPMPPHTETIVDNTIELDSLVVNLPGYKEKSEFFMAGGLGIDEVQVPIGERIRREAKESTSPKELRRYPTHRTTSSIGTIPESIAEESVISESVKDLNDAMNKAGTLVTPKRSNASRYHERSKSQPTTPIRDRDSESLSNHSTTTQSKEDEKYAATSATKNLDRFGPRELNHKMPKSRSSSTSSNPELVEAMAMVPMREPVRPKSAGSQHSSISSTSSRDEAPPPPPVHKVPTTPSLHKKTPSMEAPVPRSNNRRTSSPLKHEYQPSEDTSSSEYSSSEDSGSYSDSSSDDEIDDDEIPDAIPLYARKVSPSGSIYSLPNANFPPSSSTLAPSNSASQGPYRSTPVQCPPEQMVKNVVMNLSYWNDKGQWIDIHPGPVSVVVGPGWLRAYKLDESHFSSGSDGERIDSDNFEAELPLPLIAQELTPNVVLSRHTIDIHVRSPLMSESTLKIKGHTIRYHMLTPGACIRYYQALYESCKSNMTYNRLEEERRVNAYGTYGAAAPTNRRKSWFGRRNSYRASARAPSEQASEQSGKSSQSRLSALRSRLSGGGGTFNIAKSFIDVSQGGRPGSASLGSSEYSGITPPRTPTSMFSGTTNTAQLTDLGSSNIKIRLHQQIRNRWCDQKYAYLTVTPPPPGRRSNSTLPQGLEKHIIVTRREHDHADGPGQVLIDEVVGAHCFVMLGNKGVMVCIWDDIKGPNGEVGMVGKEGGVSGSQRKYCFQSRFSPHANWIFALVSAGA